jgi:hypothetical protein
MKKIFFLFLFVIISKTGYAQLNPGDYTYHNNEVILKFTVEDGGMTLKNLVLVYINSKTIEMGEGSWFMVNMRGADPSYSGPSGWYQFQTENCNFDFNEPGPQLTLSRFSCQNNNEDVKLVLNKK